MDSCPEWLSKVIKLPEGKVMQSATNEKSLLNFSNENYVLKGATDIIILPQEYVLCLNPRGSIQIAIGQCSSTPGNSTINNS